MNRYCWIKGTFYVNHNYDLNTLNIEARNETLLHYYQWVYFFLMFQAFMFYVPRILWCFISNKLLGYDLFNIIEAGMKYEKYGLSPDTIIKYITSNFAHKHKYLSVKASDKRNLLNNIIHENNNMTYSYKRPIWTSISSSFLTLVYVIIKIIYLINAILQIYIMNAFLSNKAHTFYGKFL
jgi:innexin